MTTVPMTEWEKRLSAEMRLEMALGRMKMDDAMIASLDAKIKKLEDDLKLFKFAAGSLDLEVERLQADNARLRGLIKDAERADGYQSYHGVTCPWCKDEERHLRDCPAFTPDGVVK